MLSNINAIVLLADESALIKPEFDI